MARTGFWTPASSSPPPAGGWDVSSKKLKMRWTEPKASCLWSHTFAILRDPNDRRAIAKKFGVDQAEVFESWIHTLTVVRNIAAHHGQLLRVKLGVSPMNYKATSIRFGQQKSFFAAATVIQYLLGQTALPHSWKADLESIFAKYPLVPIADLGFTLHWKTATGW